MLSTSPRVEMRDPAIPATPSPAAAIDLQQAVRTRRFVMASASYVAGIALILLAWRLGFVQSRAMLAIIGLVLIVNGGVYLLFRTRANLRFADPSLTGPQIALATSMVMASAFALDQGRAAALILCPVIMMYGMFRFTRRQFMAASAFMLASYALIVALLLLYKRDTVYLPLEVFRLAVLACVLPCFAVAGGKISDMRARLRDSNEELGAAIEKIKQLATHDTLTGLPNRTLFTDSLTRALARAGRHGWPVALFFMDLDRFKNINDTLGHQLGDEAIKEAARRISSCIRDSDISARLGGDEFVLLVEEFEGPTVLIEIAERILAAIYQPLSIGGHELNLSASIGICTFPIDAGDAETLLSNADIAMYQAKEQGRNRYRFYSPRFNEHSVERLALETGLRYAIERDELVVLYQPKISIQTGRIVGVEALLRWQHPELGLLRPDRFIPLAEESGLIVPIGLWVLRTACATARMWREAGMPLPVAVNLSARQFHDGRLVADIAGILAASGLAPGELELEITESTVMQNPEQAVTLMDEMRRLGVRLAMDDFGTGYSSIGHLKRFPIDSLKLDRSFVRDLPEDINDVAITRAVIAMAHTLNINVVAEGVEREAQLALLRAEGCDEYQGYLCQPPLALAELEPFVRGSGSFAIAGAGSPTMPRPAVLVPLRSDEGQATPARIAPVNADPGTVVPFKRGR
jgi:diguanylate cyclase (GGDEF)-like protein